MARSEYVYALTDLGVPPLATFTVKRELRQLLIRLQAEPSARPGLRLFRMQDGPGGMVAEMNIQDVIDGK